MRASSIYLAVWYARIRSRWLFAGDFKPSAVAIAFDARWLVLRCDQVNYGPDYAARGADDSVLVRRSGVVDLADAG
jgi:hypothetical protein